MTGDQFITALNAAIAPLTIKSMKGSSDGVTFTLSDGTTIEAKRKEIAALRDDDAMAKYVAKVTN